MRILVTGGAGYIGSHFVHVATAAGHRCTVADNLSRGHAWAVRAPAELATVDIRDAAGIHALVEKTRPDVAVHFAALAYVDESTREPELYHNVNVGGTATLLSALAALPRSVPLVFSSSCAVYGHAGDEPLTEDTRLAPVSPYGATKLEAEALIARHCLARGSQAMACRYFNVGGALPEAALGEAHDPETHLIPRAIAAAVKGGELVMYGADYPTRDGTCIRDYVHVVDLAAAHLAACELLTTRPPPTPGLIRLNLGGGAGYSNLEIVRAVERAVGSRIRLASAARRPGDTAVAVADIAKARAVLGFAPSRGLTDIIASAWRWHRESPHQRPSD